VVGGRSVRNSLHEDGILILSTRIAELKRSLEQGDGLQTRNDELDLGNLEANSANAVDGLARLIA